MSYDWVVGCSSTDLNQHLGAIGFEVYDPDMSMLTLGGGGVHCLSQTLRREAACGIQKTG